MITGQMRPLAHHPHKVAHGLASLGRGNDSMLVHRSPNEVGALNKIAMATGGALTINPHTGLPEAGWLESLLPMLAGGVATLFTAGAAAPLLAGAATGALTGDKKQSLLMRLGMGALGGMGGGGLFNALQGAGTAAAGNIAGEAASNLGTAQAAAQSSLADIVPTAALLPEGASAYGATTAANVAAAKAAAEAAVNTSANLASSQGAYAAATKALSNQVGHALGQSGIKNSLEGLQGLGSEAGRNALVQGLASQPFGAKGVIGASLAPTLIQPQESTGVEQQKPWYYTAAPGQNSLYNPGVINPNIAKLGYLPQGQSAFIGQQWNPGQYVPQYPGIPASQKPAGTIGAKAGGLMSLRHFDQGGSTSPAPSMSDALSGMNDYYKNMLNSSTTQGPMTPTITTPSPDAMNAYLARSTQMVTPQSQSQPTVADVTPPPTTAPKGVPAGIDMSKIQQYLSGMGGVGGMGGRGGMGGTYPTYTYDPATGQYTQTGGGMEGRLGGFHMAQGGLTPNYAAGGKLLHGHGDGMSDDIPAVITGQKPQRAALADGEFVVPADVVSHLGNGSTNAGAKRLYAMMDKVRQARTGNPKQGRQINPNRFMPA